MKQIRKTELSQIDKARIITAFKSLSAVATTGSGIVAYPEKVEKAIDIACDALASINDYCK